MVYVFSFPPGVYVGTLIASIPDPSILNKIYEIHMIVSTSILNSFEVVSCTRTSKLATQLDHEDELLRC